MLVKRWENLLFYVPKLLEAKILREKAYILTDLDLRQNCVIYQFHPKYISICRIDAKGTISGGCVRFFGVGWVGDIG